MRPVTFAVIGTNFISDWFMNAVRATEGVTVRAVCSRSQETGRAFADRHGIERVYTDLDALLSDETVDAVYIATPNYLHAPMAKRCILAGKHVLCEKPITQSEGDLAALLELAAQRHTVILEAMRPDFDPAYDALRAALPRIGRLRRVALTFCQYSSRYDAFRAGEVRRAFDPAIGNCALADIGIYPLHIAVALLGEPRSVRSCSVFLENGFEGAGELLLDYTPMGFTATVSYSKIADGCQPSLLEGEEGTLTVDKLTQPGRLMLYPRGGEPCTLYTSEHSGNMVYEVEAFAAMVRGEISAEPYLAVTRGTMRLFDRIVHQNGIRMPQSLL